MLVRLRVKGFKSLEDVEVRFGPLTCVVGPNGAGKSNLFDAIHFLSRLVDMPADSAAAGVRGGAGHRSPMSSLFTLTKSHRAETMEFVADFLVGDSVADEFGGTGRPSATALRYSLRLRHIEDRSAGESIVIESESLCSIPRDEAVQYLGFKSSSEFIDSVLGSSEARDLWRIDPDAAVVVHHGEQPSVAPKRSTLTHPSRTVLSSISTVEFPTALAARREMQSWVVWRLEPRALRLPDNWSAPNHMAPDGAHLPSTIERLNQSEALAYRLAGLLPDVEKVVVDVDAARRWKAFHLETTGGRIIDAGSASDGILRLLALAVMGLDAGAGNVLCIEEPENGLHPASLGAIVNLFADMVVDPSLAVDAENPLRQVIINTHAPAIVQGLSADEMLIARTYQYDGTPLSIFSPMGESWRAGTGSDSPVSAGAVSFGALLAYLEAADARLLSPEQAPNLLQDYRKRLGQAAP